MDIATINFPAVLVSAVLYFVLGAFWYSPKMFGNQWMELMNMKPEDLKGHWLSYVGAFVVALVFSCVMAHFIHLTGASTLMDGILVGFFAWLGFIATTKFASVLWEKRSFKLYIIDVVILLITMLLIGGLLAIWR